MRAVAVALSVFIAVLGAVGVIAPDRLLRITRPFRTPLGLYAAAAIRVALGATLVVVAPDSRAPAALRILGGLMVVSGILTPVVGLDRFTRIADWWSARGTPVQRAWAAVALAAGVWLVYALTW